MTDEQQKDANEAAFILQSPVFRRVFETLDAGYVAGWRSGVSGEVREGYWLRQVVLEEVRRGLFEHLNKAAVAEQGTNFKTLLKKVREAWK